MKSLMIIAPALIAACVGCASVGTDFDANQADQLQVNVTTKAEAVKILGQPRATTVTSEGISVYVWSFAHAVVFAGATSKAIYLTFNKDDILIRKAVTGSTL